jgi:hypothetical protein
MATVTYLNNPRLKCAGVKLRYTQHQIDEWQKCSGDVEYFITKYVKIVHVDRGVINFDLFDFQREIVQLFKDKRRVIVKLPRQMGKTTTTAAFFLWYILFHDNKVTAILANKAATAREILSRLKMAYEHLPLWLQQGITEWNKGSIELENGSRVLAAATSSSGIRGYSLSLVFLDEFAHVPNNIAEEFFTSIYPTISSGKDTKILIASTPNGMNHYYRFWTEAEQGRNGFTPLFYPFDAMPGRDAAWAQEQLNALGPVKYQQEVECEFLGSSNTLISGRKLRALTWVTPLETSEGFDVYVRPIPDHSYVISVDPSRGLGQDASALTIIDITEYPYRLVAKYRSTTIDPLIFPNIIYNAGTQYNHAFVLIEINDNGQQIANMLHFDLEYDNIFKLELQNKTGPGQQLSPGFKKKIQLGVKTTEPIKRIGCSNLKTIIERDKLLVTDFHTISEFSTFIQQKASYAAEEGYHDDMVMCLVLFAWLLTQKHFRESVGTDIRRAIETDLNMLVQDDTIPFGFIDNGLDTDRYSLEEGDLWAEASDVYGNRTEIDSNRYTRHK